MLWRRTLDRVLMSLIYGYGKWIGLALALVVTGVAVGFWVVSTS